MPMFGGGPVTIETSGPAAVAITSGTMAAQTPGIFDAGLAQRLYIIAQLLFLAVYYEDPTTPNHSARIGYLRSVATNPKSFVDGSIIYMILADGVTNAGSTDQGLANRFGDVLDALSYGYKAPV